MVSLRFDRLRLNGFKSFADPTELVIADGLTGVVGPNGCGKSNLLEALRWVMGENRPTAIRGEGMEDVIFAGTTSRPARHFAEVVLGVDNHDRAAPAAFNDHERLEVSRRVARDLGSTYRVNGKEVRARDVQMLFLDAASGAHSPALVRQGQIAELIAARPRARRRVLEEAAGIAGLYQRRHEAELRLQATAANLARLDDILEQMAGQLASLTRQVRQAARYRELGAALRRAEGALLLRRWHEADAARAATAAETLATTRQQAAAVAAATTAATARQAAEDALPARREEQAIAGAITQRLHQQVAILNEQQQQATAAIAAATARLDQLQRDTAREAALNADADRSVAALEDELESLLAAQQAAPDELVALSQAATLAAAALAGHEAALTAATDEAAGLTAAHQAAERRAQAAALAQEQARRAIARATAAQTQARQVIDAGAEELAIAGDAADEAVIRADDALVDLTAAEGALATARDVAATARARRAGADGTLAALTAELAALTPAPESMPADPATGPPLSDQMLVAPGFEVAVAAAFGDGLQAPAAVDGGRGWRTLPDPAVALPPLPAGATPLARHVQAPAVLGRRLALTGLVATAEGARLQAALAPGQRLVSAAGEIWRWDGWHGVLDPGGAVAAHLQRQNRRRQLQADCDQAAAAADQAAAAEAMAAAAVAAATAAEQQARATRRAADDALGAAIRARTAAEVASTRAGADLATATAALAVAHEQDAEAAVELEDAQATLAELPDPVAGRAAVAALRDQVQAARHHQQAAVAAHEAARSATAAATRRQQQVMADLARWNERLANARHRAAELAARMATAVAECDRARAVPAELAAQATELARTQGANDRRLALANDRLAAAEAAWRQAVATERAAEQAAASAGAEVAAATARAEGAQAAAETAARQLHGETGLAPAALLERLGLDLDTLPPAAMLDAEVQRLRRQRDALGAVNLRAEADAAALQQEHDGLQAEKADLEAASDKLRAAITALNRDGRARLLAAFEQVNTSFAALFTHLFNGGEARLVLVESDDPLEAGLEIMCQPPGKKLAVLSLLSGGEQTLTALALIFAVFLANPAPICVLDEVDAPLDDANVMRFCDLLDEMTRRTATRFLIITHHAVTMARMDRLFGVTMQERGVSQLVSVDLAGAVDIVG